MGWDRYATFWADVVRSTFPAAPDPRFSVSARATTDGLEIEVRSAETLAGETTGTATVTFPDGTRRELDLTRTDLSTFAAELAGGSEGIYSVAVRLQRDGTDVFRDAVTAIRSYSPEYASQEGDPGYLAQLTEAGDGRLDPEPARAFEAAGLRPGSSTVPLWPLLALLALMMLPADVGLRRLRLERGDWRRARTWLRERVQRRSGAADTAEEAAAGRLLRARQEARVGGPGHEDGDEPADGDG